jgi:hypothetical protein
MGELLIRAGHADHRVVGDLLAPGGAIALRRPIDRLVADAHTAARRQELAEAASAGGVPFLVDPLTPLLQVPVAENDPWVRRLSFGTAYAQSPSEMSELDRERLAWEVVETEVELGATAIIPPYLFCDHPGDPAFEVSLDLLATTGRIMRREGVNLPLLPVLCAQHRSFCGDDSWPGGIDRFAAAAAELGPHAIAVCFSPCGAPGDSYAKVLRLFTAMQRLKRCGAPTLAWRQGIFGPGLVAAGLDGYETGIGVGERSDVKHVLASRAPKRSQARRGGPPSMIYLEPLGRSVPRPVAETLLGDRAMRARLLCDDERCCPDGVHSMLDDSPSHAVRSRARRLTALDDMPHRSWRLHQIAKEANTAAMLAKKGTLVLGAEGETTQLPSTAQDALARVAEFLRAAEAHQLTA